MKRLFTGWQRRRPGGGARGACVAAAPLAAAIGAAVAGLVAFGCAQGHRPPADEARLGYFPNITHAAALVGARRGDYERAVAPVRLVQRVFNAGPQAIEALFAGEIDILYVGSGPAINAYARSRGRALRVVAGAASGGAGLVVRRDSGIRAPADLRRKAIGTPQLGNTQDIALRAWLGEHGLAPADKGGSVRVVPIANPDILSLMARGELQGAWVPEPWLTRLIEEAEGELLIDERDLWPEGRFATAVVAVSDRFLGARPDLVRRLLSAHVDLTLWIRDHPDEARRQINRELERLLGKPLPEPLLAQALSRLELTYDPISPSLLRGAERAFRLGFLGAERPEVEGLVDLGLLNDVLAERRLPAVAGGGRNTDARSE
jgi:NitT/TauT family transport system substrate-binding protein